jgi:hypothetical protein
MDTQPDRHQALVDLIDLRKPIDAAIRTLAAHPWGTAPEVVFGGQQITRALEMFLAGEVNPRDLEQWADAIEGRDDIEYEPSRSPEVAEFLFDISTPQINGALTQDRASEWMQRFA